jgi:hypothetical protein
MEDDIEIIVIVISIINISVSYDVRERTGVVEHRYSKRV